MSTASLPSAQVRLRKPRLVFFYGATDGASRRGEGYLDQVLQRRGNHETFAQTSINVDDRPDLAERFRVLCLPTIVVITGNVVRARLEQPRGARQIHDFLQPWLR